MEDFTHCSFSEEEWSRNLRTLEKQDIYHCRVISLLDATLPNKWDRQGGPIRWLPLPPNLTPFTVIPRVHQGQSLHSSSATILKGPVTDNLWYCSNECQWRYVTQGTDRWDICSITHGSHINHLWKLECLAAVVKQLFFPICDPNKNF